ncbi:alpha/beta fold hydrolase [Halegenticoccus soli]|uniref:alpha/beta fold hydrolase n=1 Tax=Halegenticoccus soli TaxID=1985678 RepID=UPI000C6CD8DA|nr:alpha/beta hydrolase [Halegenticoccus soli]
MNPTSTRPIDESAVDRTRGPGGRTDEPDIPPSGRLSRLASARLSRSIGAQPFVPPVFAPTTETERGRLLDEYPYVRVGDGPRTLVVLPGFGDAMFDGDYPPAAAWALGAYYRRLADEYAVYLLSRPRGLPEGQTIGEMADGHARVFEEALGPASVLGLSMGGMIAQRFAARRPDLVERLVLGVTGGRVDEEGRPIVRRMERDARERDWFSIRAELARRMFSDWRRFLYPPMIQSAGRFVLPRPAVASDVWVSLRAILEYDGTDELGEIEVPTLVVVGTDDVFFPERTLRETAEGIPDAELHLIRGAKHGAFHERKREFDARVAAFLDAR